MPEIIPYELRCFFVRRKAHAVTLHTVKTKEDYMVKDSECMEKNDVADEMIRKYAKIQFSFQEHSGSLVILDDPEMSV